MADESLAADRELERVALSIGIPPCPAILVDLLAESKKGDPDSRRIEKLVAMDVGLTAALLKTVNSPFFGLSTKVSSVRQSIALIGISMMTRMVSGLVLRNAFAVKDKAAMEQFWDASAKLAMVTAFMAKQFPGVKQEEAYTFALFQNCGVPILMQRFADYADTYSRASAADDRKFTEIEDEAHSTNHATMGYLLTKSWHLPEEISQAIRFHHEAGTMLAPESPLPANCRDLIAVGLLANRALADQAGRAAQAEWLSDGAATLSHLGVSGEEFEDLLGDVKIMLE